MTPDSAPHLVCSLVGDLPDALTALVPVEVVVECFAFDEPPPRMSLAAAAFFAKCAPSRDVRIRAHGFARTPDAPLVAFPAPYTSVRDGEMRQFVESPNYYVALRLSGRSIVNHPHTAACVVKLLDAFAPIRDWTQPFGTVEEERYVCNEINGTVRLLCSDHRDGCHKARTD